MTKSSRTLHNLATLRDEYGNDHNLFVSRDEARRLGDHVARGITDHVYRIFLIWLALLFVIGALDAHGMFRPIDATDAGFAERSGMRLRTDHGTGCQYLESADGNLTPRLTVAGKQAGCK